MTKYILLITVSFFSGSIMYSYIIPKLFYKKDITKLSEDKNPGTANVMHCVGILPGILCLILDILKGFVPLYFASRHTDISNMMFSLIIAAPIAGHAFSPFLKFHGGKAIAVTFGVLLGLFPFSNAFIYLAAAMIFLSVVIKITPHSLRVIISMIAFSVCCILFEDIRAIITGAIVVSGIVIIKHLANYGIEKAKISFILWDKYIQKKNI